MGILANELRYKLLDDRHARRSAHEDHFIDVIGAQPGVIQCLLERPLGALGQRGGQVFKARTR